MAEKIEIDLSVKNNELSKALDQSSKKALELEGILSTALGVFGGTVITKAFDSFLGGLNSVVAVGKEAVNAAAQQEVAVNNLNNALARSGNYTQQASQDLQDFATQLQATTVYEDDAILSTAAYLESLTNLSTDGLKQATKASADLATVLGIDLESASSLVAKAIEGNSGALGRYGIQIKKGADEAERLSNVVNALNTKFGGAASAQLNTYSGSVASLNNAYGEVYESIGNVIVQNPLVISAINQLKKSFLDTSTEVTRLNPELQDLLNDGFFAVAAGAQVFANILDGFTVIAKAVVGSISYIGNALLASLVGPIESAIDGFIFLGQKIPGIGDAFAGLENPIGGATQALQSFANDGLNTVINAAENNVFRSLSDNIENFTNATIDGSAKVASESVKNNETRVKNEQETSDQILNARRSLNAELLTLRAQLASEEKAFQDTLTALSLEDETAQNEAKIAAIADQKMREAEAVYQGELLKNEQIADAQQKALANDKAYQAMYLSTKKAYDEKIIAQNKLINDKKKKDDADYEKAKADTLSRIATLSSESNKTLAAIGKAAALTQIAIDGPAAVVNAYKNIPAPLNIPAAAAVAAAVAAQAAKVVGVKLEQGGFVGGVTGATMGPDNRIVQVRDGEMVLNAEQQRNLLGMINSGGSTGDIVVNIDGREVFRAVRNQLRSGMTFA